MKGFPKIVVGRKGLKQLMTYFENHDRTFHLKWNCLTPNFNFIVNINKILREVTHYFVDSVRNPILK